MARPDFISIGPPKTGTTWLFTILSDHPKIWLPPVKEIQYFWGFGKRNNLPKNKFKRLLRQAFGYSNIRWRKKYLLEKFHFYKTHQTRLKLKDVMWDLYYILCPPNPVWYRSLFLAKEGILTGDFSPTYSLLTTYEIKKIATLYPDMKILITLRNPIDRLWSEIKMYSVSDDDVSEESYLKKIKELGELYNYKKIVSDWKSCFKDSNVRYFYYDQLVSDPEQYIRSICEFLGIETDFLLNNKNFKTHIFKGAKIQLPDNLYQLMTKVNYKNLEDWALYSGDEYAVKWFRDATAKQALTSC